MTVAAAEAWLHYLLAWSVILLLHYEAKASYTHTSKPRYNPTSSMKPSEMPVGCSTFTFLLIQNPSHSRSVETHNWTYSMGQWLKAQLQYQIIGLNPDSATLLLHET